MAAVGRHPLLFLKNILRRRHIELLLKIPAKNRGGVKSYHIRHLIYFILMGLQKLGRLFEPRQD
jgi:hypothetical protein